VQIAGFVNEPPHGAARTAILRPTGRIRPQSPSGNTHVSGESGPGTASIDNEIVPPRLVIDRASDGGLEDSVFRRGAQGSSEVYGIVLPQAHIERSSHVTRTRLQDSQKLCVKGAMNPMRPPVSRMRAYRAGPPVR
jgi:hypothetical protein